ncbi:MAG: hypothetical protein H0V40_01290 [Actinobacteria bacterium]|nr:hypothetical protein [Actinomycetota bacterium]
MSELEFLSTDRTRTGGGFEPVFRSPLADALAAAGPDVRDLSALGKVEVRGDVEGFDGLASAERIPLTPGRTLFLCAPEETARLREALADPSRTVVDVTGALAGLELRGERLLRRLTDLDLDGLPAVGAVARVTTIVLRTGEEFRLFFPQEYARSMAEVVLDAAAGL